MKIPDSWEGLRVGVLGLGRSGRGAARLLAGVGASVYASDVADDEELRAQAERVRGLGVEVELGGHDAAILASCDYLVVSPGIPPSADIFKTPGIGDRPMISELELAFNFLDAPVIAVTGTNGKTTTTAWIGAMLEDAGLRAGVGGNIGRALSELAADGQAFDWVVVEASSFQLAHTVRFNPAIGVLLNLRPDHLDRYVDVERYYADKARLFANATSKSRWVLNAEDEGVIGLTEGCPGRRRYFAVTAELGDDREGAFLGESGALTVRCDAEEVELVDRKEIRLLGSHNVANALAASLVAAYAQLPVPSIRETLRRFEPLPHRLQPVGEYGGVQWINDSKATNIASTRVALGAIGRPVVLLLGGRGKGESFSDLLSEATVEIRAVVAYGEAAGQIEAELADRVSVVREDGPFEEVVRLASRLARPGDAVLLSPACASFDMFRDFEERGTRFAVLAEGERA